MMFEELKVFEDNKTFLTIKNEINNGNFFHANIFYSKDSFTNNNMALLCAMKLLCENIEVCFECENCAKVLKNSHPDLFVFDNKFLTADAETIIEQSLIKPMLSSRKVFLIYNFEQATVQAQNKLLKILEEPPKNVYFILTATSQEKILLTVKSRCKTITIFPFDKAELEQKLKILGETQIPANVAIYSDGYIGISKDILSSKDFAENFDWARDVVFKLKSSKDIVMFSKPLKNKNNFSLRLAILEDIYRDIIFALLGKTNSIKNTQIATEIISACTNFTTDALIEIINLINTCQKRYEANVNITLLTDTLLLKILEVKYLCSQK